MQIFSPQATSPHYRQTDRQKKYTHSMILKGSQPEGDEIGHLKQKNCGHRLECSLTSNRRGFPNRPACTNL